MGKKKRIALAILLSVIADLLVFLVVPNEQPENYTLNITMEADQSGIYQFFYSNDGIFDFDKMQQYSYEKAGEKEELSFQVPVNYNEWRMDFGDADASVKIYSAEVKYKGSTYKLENEVFVNSEKQHSIQSMEEKKDYLEIKVESDDPQCMLDVPKEEIQGFLKDISDSYNTVKRIVACVMIDILLLGICMVGNRVVSLFRELKGNRALIFNLAKNDFKTRFAGSYLGVVWAFIQPIITVLVYWFVFQVGLRSGDVGDFPFVLWLIAGLVPWFFFQEALSFGTNALIEYQYLVKKIVFKISTLPVVKVLSALYVHIFFILFTLILYSCYGYFPDLYTLQIVYYTFCTFIFVLAFTYITCSVVVFFRDVIQIISIVLQIGVWMTPIMWQISILPKGLVWIFKLNPMYYIVAGYRDALINKVWFWDNFYLTLWFWFVTLGLFGVGTVVFKRLKVHFADVL